MTTRVEKDRRIAAAIEREATAKKMNDFMRAFNAAVDGAADDFKAFLPVCDLNLQVAPEISAPPIDIPGLLCKRARAEDPFIRSRLTSFAV